MASSDDTALKNLDTSIKSAQTLCDHLATALTEIYKNPSAPPDEPSSKINPVALGRDAVTLVRAHATKLSLLIINEPFTPSAIADVLGLLLSGPVQGVATASQVCDPAQHTAFFRKELAWRSKCVLVTLGDLLRKIPRDGKILSGAKKGAFTVEDKGSLPATGLLWSACDEMLALVNMGIGGYFVKKINEWRDTLKDVIEELKEWGEEEPEDDSSGEDIDDDDDDSAYATDNNAEDHTPSAQDIIDGLMSSGQAIPGDDPKSIRPRLESTLRRARLVVLLCQAIGKRRLKSLPPMPPPSDSAYKNMPERLDEASRVLSALPDKFGDLASAFYDMEPGPIDQAADDCFFAASAASELLSASWDGSRDEFSEWTDKFKTEIKNT